MFGKRAAPSRDSRATSPGDRKADVDLWRIKYEQLRQAADQAIHGQDLLLRSLHHLSGAESESDRHEAAQLAKDASAHTQEAVGYYENLKKVHDSAQALFNEVDANGPISFKMP